MADNMCPEPVGLQAARTIFGGVEWPAGVVGLQRLAFAELQFDARTGVAYVFLTPHNRIAGVRLGGAETAAKGESEL